MTKKKEFEAVRCFPFNGPNDPSLANTIKAFKKKRGTGESRATKKGGGVDKWGRANQQWLEAPNRRTWRKDRGGASGFRI
jgi:hypothetical protein